MSWTCYNTGSKQELIDHSRVGGRKVFIKEVSSELNLVGWVIFATGVMRFAGGSAVKNPPAVQETQVYFWVGEIPWRKAWQLQYSCLGNPVDRGAWWATVHAVAKESDTT